MATRPSAPSVFRIPGLARFCQENDIAFLGIFGSLASGRDTPESDVDLLVRFSKPKGLLALVRIERELAQRVARKVDLVTENSLSPYLRDRIKSATKALYGRAR